MTTLLRTESLSVTFGGLRAVNDVSLEVGEGELVGLIGPNGAGKTTFIDAVTGYVPSTGHATFCGRSIDGLAPHRRARLGLGRTWQSLELFDDLTIEENLLVASERPSVGGFLADLVVPRRARARESVDFALDVLGIRELAPRMPTEISQGQRKLVSAARALAARPRVVCMDEPAAGLDTAESAVLGRRLRAVVEAGISILLVDHDMGLVLGICDRIHVIEFGRTIAEGGPEEVAADPRVVEAYLGQSANRGGSAAPGGSA
jgi:branched-chain amino acid transport system ATP-binding protein